MTLPILGNPVLFIGMAPEVDGNCHYGGQEELNGF
jgi:hypothetical protein